MYDNIARDSMNKSKLKKLRRKLRTLRLKGGITGREMAKFANACGRKQRGESGGHPAYFSEYFPEERDISIPSHGATKGGTLTKGTAHSILDALEGDLDRLQDMLDNETRGNNE
jgi:hypothetical protein